MNGTENTFASVARYPRIALGNAVLLFKKVTVDAAGALDTKIKIAHLSARVGASARRDREIRSTRIADQCIAFEDMDLPCTGFALLTYAGREKDDGMVLKAVQSLYS